ncbi:MAG TPA: Hsp20/alpha crystallin family protein [Xanthobacteraceae bacterium]|nr:Hsp20/alpha crystallin family protein [Xanthobacteraceae bacterium]HZT36712.1 Hsp20/alpha crystallin family protein [Bryobacteraceae bacterium]
MRELQPWRPFSELERWARRFESSFPHMFEDIDSEDIERRLPIESYVKDGSLVVRADVPGLDPKDIDVSVLGNVLTIKGERKDKQEVKKDDYFRREISYGVFERRTTLPEGAQTDKIRATFKNGVIEVTMPLAKEATAKKVPIENAH